MIRQPSSDILVAGASGYIGGRLVPRLLSSGHRVRALARSPDKLKSRPWADHQNLSIVKGDVLDRSSLKEAMGGCRAVYYLIHSMNPAVSDFAKTDQIAAENMAEAAAQAGVQQIIYLGGLGDEQSELSHHLRSRCDVGKILQSGTVPVTILRAAMIIGSGSASFEILRYLVDRLPLMLTPKWVDTPCQPIGVRNVLYYLSGCLDKPETFGQTFDIGQEKVTTYRELMKIYAEEAGLPNRRIRTIPFLTPGFSSYWIHLVTPIPAALARPLAEGLRNPVICRENRMTQLLPQELFDARKAIRLALERVRQQQVETSWSDSGLMRPAEWSIPGDPAWAGGSHFEDVRRAVLDATPEDIWPSIQAIGGEVGYYYGNWLWRIRGVVDRLLGGVGLIRGRRSSQELYTGDAIDFWRVLNIKAPQQLSLIAEMKLPGKAILSFQLSQLEPHKTELIQTARFLPKGLWGLIYWYGISPAHHFVFNGMINGIARAAKRTILSGPAPVHHHKNGIEKSSSDPFQ